MIARELALQFGVQVIEGLDEFPHTIVFESADGRRLEDDRLRIVVISLWYLAKPPMKRCEQEEDHADLRRVLKALFVLRSREERRQDLNKPPINRRGPIRWLSTGGRCISPAGTGFRWT